MPRLLTVAQKLLSLKERFQIYDDSDQVVFDCTWRFAWINARWVLTREGREVAAFRKRVWSVGAKWDVQSELGEFLMRRKIFSFRRRIFVEGGPLDGAEFTGGLFDLSFALEHQGATLAKAHAKILTLRERHLVEVLDDRPEVELLTAILMTCLLVEKHQERAAQVAAAGAAGAAASSHD
jgi:uncharacterized protein YxjI